MEPKGEAKATLTVKNVPRPLIDALRKRAAQNHRSLQGELRAILDRAASEPRQLTVSDVFKRIQERGVKTRSESAAIVRELRDSR